MYTFEDKGHRSISLKPEGTAGATESAKECDSVLPEGSDIGLGSRGRAFESLHSDQRTVILIE